MELVRGVNIRHTPDGLPFVRVHYMADPERDPSIHPEWKKRERRKYSSQGGWDREQEIIHAAGGGERLFADILNKWPEKIFIDPAESGFEIDPDWRILNGFDHGKTNPTAALHTRINFEGTIFILAEYYQPNLSPKQHKANLAKLTGFMTGRTLADPSIFYKSQAQSDGSFKAINDLYRDEEIRHLQPAQETTEITGMERILAHWMNLDESEASIRVVCPRRYWDIQSPMYGVHNEGCPNLIWELRRCRREELTAKQLITNNPSEAIVDKDNHLRDCLKYIVLSLPHPSRKTQARQIQERLEKISDPTSRSVEYLRMKDKFTRQNQPVKMPGDWRSRVEEQ